MPFVPSRTHLYKNHSFTQTVALLVDKLGKIHPKCASDSWSAGSLGDIALRRACRTGAGSDSLFMVQKLLCVEGTFAKHCSDPLDPPIKLDLYFDQTVGALCSRSQVWNIFAVHDIDNLEQLSGLESHEPLPWVKVETLVSDFTNFKSCEHRRTLDLTVYVPYGNREYSQL